MADVVMPQMGESIFEGTITKWLKKPGDKVERDEPLFEISTDKVDAEIPAPAAGVLREIKVAEGKTVPIQTVVAVIDVAGAAPAPQAQSGTTTPQAQPRQRPRRTNQAHRRRRRKGQDNGTAGAIRDNDTAGPTGNAWRGCGSGSESAAGGEATGCGSSDACHPPRRGNASTRVPGRSS